MSELGEEEGRFRVRISVLDHETFDTVEISVTGSVKKDLKYIVDAMDIAKRVRDDLKYVLTLEEEDEKELEEGE